MFYEIIHKTGLKRPDAFKKNAYAIIVNALGKSLKGDRGEGARILNRARKHLPACF